MNFIHSDFHNGCYSTFRLVQLLMPFIANCVGLQYLYASLVIYVLLLCTFPMTLNFSAKYWINITDIRELILSWYGWTSICFQMCTFGRDRAHGAKCTNCLHTNSIKCIEQTRADMLYMCNEPLHVPPLECHHMVCESIYCACVWSIKNWTNMKVTES